MQVIIEVQVTEPCDTAVVLHEEQAIKVLGEVEVLETHMEVKDNLKEVVPPQDQAFYMGLDPHQDPCLIKEDHKALEVAGIPTRSPRRRSPTPTQSRRTTRPWRWRWRTTTRPPSIGPRGGPPGPPGGLGNNPPNHLDQEEIQEEVVAVEEVAVVEAVAQGPAPVPCRQPR